MNAEVTLDKSKAFSYWNISVEGLNGHELTSVAFPKIAGLNEMENEELVIPTWMGSLFAEPRKTLKRGSGKMEWTYPGALSSQVIAIYNPEKTGFYASCDDSLSFAKNFSLTFDSLNTLVYRMINYPSFDSSLVSYSPAYKSVIGCSFRRLA